MTASRKYRSSRDSRAGIPDGDLHPFRGSRYPSPGGDIELAPVRHRLEGVQDDIQKQLPHLAGIGMDGTQVGGQPLIQFHGFRSGLELQDLENVSQDPVDVDALLPGFRGPRKAQQAAGDLDRLVRLVLHDLHVLQQRGIVLHFLLHELGHVQDDAQRGAQLVGDPRRERPERRHRLGPHHLLLRNFQFLVGFLQGLLRFPHAKHLLLDRVRHIVERGCQFGELPVQAFHFVVEVPRFQGPGRLQKPVHGRREAAEEDRGQHQGQQRPHGEEKVENVFRAGDIPRHHLRLRIEFGVGEGDHILDFPGQRLSGPKRVVLFCRHPGGTRPDGKHPAHGVLVQVGTVLKVFDAGLHRRGVVATETAVDQTLDSPDIREHDLELP